VRAFCPIPGPPLLGFADAFDEAYGRSDTPKPYPKVTPSKVGNTLLPFPCPHCDVVCPVMITQRRAAYCDAKREHCWCPNCRKRYILDVTGQSLSVLLPPDATFAPACVNGKLKKPQIAGLTLLGTHSAR